MSFNYSVIIRTKNSERTIKACLDSLLTQTLKPVEIIVVDSGSTDSTLDIIKAYNVTLLYYPEDKLFNYSKALNIGIAQVSSAYVFILSSHVELIHANTVQYMLQVLTSHTNCITVSTNRASTKDAQIIHIESLESVKKNRIDIENFKGRAMYNFCSVIRKESWERYPFNENIPTCEDQDWSYHFIKKGYFTEFILNPAVFYKNPYYNIQKDVFETLTIGRLVYPYFISKHYMIKMFKRGAKKILSGQIQASKFDLLLGWSIFKYRFFGVYQNKSIYNKQLQS